MRLDFEPAQKPYPLADFQPPENFEFHVAPDLDSILKKGIAAAQNGDRDNARKLLSQATALNPASEDAWMWLASISDYPEELIAFLDRVLSINPENSRALEWRDATRSLLAKTFVQRAESAYAQGSPDLASKCLEQALEYDNDCAAAWFLLGSRAEDVARKLECFERVLEIEPAHEGALSCISLIERERSQAAFEEAKQAAASGNQALAVELLDAYLEEDPESVEGWILRSHISPSVEQKVDALEKALELDPENAAARSGLAFIALAFGSNKEESENGSLDPVSEHADAASEPSIDPDHSEVMTAPEYLVEDTPSENSDNSRIETSESTESENHWASMAKSSEPEAYMIEDSEEMSECESSLGEAESLSEPTRSLEEIFGAVPEPVNTENETVENLSPFVPAIEREFHSEVEETALSSESSDPQSNEWQSPGEVIQPLMELQAHTDGIPCPFCGSENEQQSINCNGCRAVLTLSDLEALFSVDHADRETIQTAVTEMEAEWNLREFNVEELTDLGLGHFNLGNPESGLRYLQEASRLDPNNVILSGTVNAIAIRFEEIRRQNELHESQPTGKTILVVDDSPTVRKLISGKLEKSGHIVVCANDGIEALERLENGLPDLVLLDITMPRMDGYEVCKQIRSNPAAKDLPVVMISGKDGFFDKVRGRMAGSTGYVTKPFGPETLMKALETYLLPEAQ